MMQLFCCSCSCLALKNYIKCKSFLCCDCILVLKVVPFPAGGIQYHVDFPLVLRRLRTSYNGSQTTAIGATWGRDDVSCAGLVEDVSAPDWLHGPENVHLEGTEPPRLQGSLDSWPSQAQPQQEGIHQCRFCPYTSRYPQNITSHERRHTGEKPFSCHFCPKAFGQNSHRLVHERTHTGEKPFRCEVCQKAFVQKSDMLRHKKIHTGGRKPHQCETCGKAFMFRYTLLDHERIHSGDRPYVCEVCGQTYTRSCHLKDHQKRRHM